MADAYRWAKSHVSNDAEPLVVFIDPPYADYEDHPERIGKLLEVLVRKLPDGSIISSESSRRLDSEILPDFESWDIRRYGGTRIAIRTIGEAAEPVDESTTEGAPDVVE
jgi:16S rRNA G966 N2-methylase RsmD